MSLPGCVLAMPPPQLVLTLRTVLLSRSYNSAWRASSALCEWSVLALDQLLLVLRARGKPAERGMAMHVEAGQSAVLQAVFKLLFQQMSGKLKVVARRKVRDFLAANVCLECDKDVSAMLAALSASDTAATLKHFTPYLADKIRGAAQAEKFLTWCVAVCACLAASLWWWWRPLTTRPHCLGRHLRLLGGVVRHAGAALLPYIPTVRECVDIGLASEDKDVRVEAARTLRHALRGISEIYATDLRSVSPAEWDAGYLWHSWAAPRSWDASQLGVQWHIPTPEERVASHELFKA